MRNVVLRLLLLLSVAALTAACGDQSAPAETVTKPAGEAAKTAPATTDTAASTPQPIVIDGPCNPSLTQEQCAEANAALTRDFNSLAKEIAASAKAIAAEAREVESKLPSVSELMKKECEQQELNLVALRRLQNPGAGEVISAEEAARIPAEIAKAQSLIEKNCK